MFAAIGGSTVFSKIDLLHAYLLMELDDGASKLCTIMQNSQGVILV